MNWNDVKYSTPGNNIKLWCWDGIKVRRGFYYNGKFFQQMSWASLDNVTHWQVYIVPAPPINQ